MPGSIGPLIYCLPTVVNRKRPLGLKTIEVTGCFVVTVPDRFPVVASQMETSGSLAANHVPSGLRIAVWKMTIVISLI